MNNLTKWQRRALLDVRAAGAAGCERPKGVQIGTLATLEMRGLIVRDVAAPVPPRRAPRAVFRLTPAGSEAAHAAGLLP